MCSKHSALTVAKGSSCGHEAFSQKFVSQPMTPGHEASAPVKGAPSSFPQNFVSQPMTPPPGHEASSTAPGCLKDICLSQPIIADRTASQCTPPGCFTQMGHSSLSSLDPKVPTRNVPEKMYSTAGVYNFALNDDPDILYNPYMGHSYTRTLATGTKVKVRDTAQCCTYNRSHACCRCIRAEVFTNVHRANIELGRSTSLNLVLRSYARFVRSRRCLDLSNVA